MLIGTLDLKVTWGDSGVPRDSGEPRAWQWQGGSGDM